MPSEVELVELIRMKTASGPQGDIIKLLQTNMVVFKENLNLIVSSCIERLGNSITEPQALAGFATILRQNYTTVPPIQELEEENQSDTVSKVTFKDAKNREDSFSPRLPHYFTFKPFEHRREMLNKSEPTKGDLSIVPPSPNRSHEYVSKEYPDELFVKKAGRHSFDAGYLQNKSHSLSSEPGSFVAFHSANKKHSVSEYRGEALEPKKPETSKTTPRNFTAKTPNYAPIVRPPKLDMTQLATAEYASDSDHKESKSRSLPKPRSKLEAEHLDAGTPDKDSLRNNRDSQEYMAKIKKLMKMMTNLKAKAKAQPFIPRITSLRELDEVKQPKKRYTSGSSTPSRQETRASETVSQLSLHGVEARTALSSEKPSAVPLPFPKGGLGRRVNKERHS